MAEYWIGVLTPFAMVAAVLLLWLLAAAARLLWSRLHRAFSTKLVVTRNLPEWGSSQPAPKPEYWDDANRIRDSLLVIPKLRVWAGFGRLFIVARDVQHVFDEDTREWVAATDAAKRDNITGEAA